MEADLSELIVVEDRVDENCVRHVHLMANAPVGENWLDLFGAPEGTRGRQTLETGAHHLRADWPHKGPLEIKAEAWPQAKRTVAWSLAGCENAREAMRQAALAFTEFYSTWPEMAFLRNMPKGAEFGQAVDLGEFELLVFEAQWAPGKCVVVF